MLSLKILSGSTSPDGDLLGRAQKFRRLVTSPDFQLSGKHLDKIVLKKSKVVPKRARRGAGALWLEVFRDYRGDKCILFPFRTAAAPRGRVTYNFKMMEAHRAMCIMVHKLPPDDDRTMALHSCGNGHLGCVNPSHLYWGNQSDNCRDAHRHAKEGKPTAA